MAGIASQAAAVNDTSLENDQPKVLSEQYIRKGTAQALSETDFHNEHFREIGRVALGSAHAFRMCCELSIFRAFSTGVYRLQRHAR